MKLLEYIGQSNKEGKVSECGGKAAPPVARRDTSLQRAFPDARIVETSVGWDAELTPMIAGLELAERLVGGTALIDVPGDRVDGQYMFVKPDRAKEDA